MRGVITLLITGGGPLCIIYIYNISIHIYVYIYNYIYCTPTDGKFTYQKITSCTWKSWSAQSCSFFIQQIPSWIPMANDSWKESTSTAFLQNKSFIDDFSSNNLALPASEPYLQQNHVYEIFVNTKKKVLWKLPPYSSEPKQTLTSIFFKSTFALLKPTALAIFAKDFAATCYTSLGMKRDVSTYRICILVYTVKNRKYISMDNG